MATTSQITPDAYRAAHEAAVFVDRSTLGMLKITGETRLDLLHRMSTQDLNSLSSGEGAATVFTTEIGRIIDRIIVYVSSDTVYALTGETNSDPFARYLMRFVFFNDDFHLEDVSTDTAIFGVYGPQAGTLLAAAGFPQTDLPLHQWRQATVDGTTAYIHRTDPVAGDGYFVMGRQEDAAVLRAALEGTGITGIDDAAFDLLRIESGQPRFDHELTSDYIPLETGLWPDVSFHKGCYVGQEIIARMESRGKLAKQMVVLRPEAPVAAGAAITAGGKAAGSVTSAAVGPDGPLALGYVKTAVLEAGTPLLVGETPAEVLAQSQAAA